MMDLFLKNTQLHMHKTITDGLESCVLLVDYCNVFISFHSDGTHSLQKDPFVSKSYNANFLKSALIKKQTHLHFGWPEGEYIYIFFT